MYVGQHARQCSYLCSRLSRSTYYLFFCIDTRLKMNQYIIMAMHARPIPIDPFNPAGIEDTIRHPSPYIPIRIPVFSVVVWLNDILVRVISLVGAFGGPRPNGPATMTHSRAFSDSVESAEEGEAVPLVALNAPAKPSTRIRVSRGPRANDRRKLD